MGGDKVDKNIFKIMMDHPDTKIYENNRVRGEIVKRFLNELIKKSDDYAQGIVREELSELDIEISKSVRGKHDRMGMLEEMADTVIGNIMLQFLYNYPDEELQKAIDVKLARIEDKLEKGNVQ